jgi:spore coat polysaccharide biosynthesis protein SpsF
MKAIKPIHGRSMIAHLIDRLKLAQCPDEIIICTSTKGQDAPLVDIARQEHVQVYQGHPEDVLLRLTHAAALFNVDTVVNCTADNPFVDPIYIDRLVDFHHAHGYDYSRVEGLPFGTFSYTLSYPAMVRACEIKAKTDTEVWGSYFTETGLFSWGELHVIDPQVRWPELRLTVDTLEDFELARRIFDHLHKPGEIFTLSEIVALCRQHPELVAINADVQQKPPPPIEVKIPRERSNG